MKLYHAPTTVRRLHSIVFVCARQIENFFTAQVCCNRSVSTHAILSHCDPDLDLNIRIINILNGPKWTMVTAFKSYVSLLWQWPRPDA